MPDESSRIQSLIAEAKEKKATHESASSFLPRPAMEMAARNLDCIIRQLEDPKPLCCPRCGQSVQIDPIRSSTVRLIYDCPCLQENEELWWHAIIGTECQLTIMKPRDRKT